MERRSIWVRIGRGSIVPAVTIALTMATEVATEGAAVPMARPHSPSALVAFTACVHRTELDRAAAANLVKKPLYPNSALEGL